MLFLAGSAWAEGPSPTSGIYPHYSITAEYDDEAGLILGKVMAQGINLSEAPLDHLILFAYPNRFTEPNAGLDDSNYFRNYPGNFDPGWIKISDVAFNGPAGAAALELLPVPARYAPARTVWRLDLPSPLPPGGAFTLECLFSTRIPVKHGPFGRNGDALYLKGGWAPYLADVNEQGAWQISGAPPRASWDLDLRDGAGLSWVVEDEGPLSGPRLRWRGENLRSVSLSAARAWTVEEQAVGGARARLLLRKPDPERANALLALAKESLEIRDAELMRALVDVPSATPPLLVMVETPLLDELYYTSERALWLSDRALKIFPLGWLENFHQMRIRRGILEQLAKPILSPFERAGDLDWVSEAVGWRWMLAFMRERETRQPDARGALWYLRFIPQVDQFIYAPKVPFVYAFFNTSHEKDIYRESVERFNNPIAAGRALYEGMEDSVGPAMIDRIASGYLQRRDIPFVRFALAQAEQSQQAFLGESGAEAVEGPAQRLRRFFDQLRRPPGRLDYEFEKLTCEEGEAEAVSRIDLRRLSDDPDRVDPVTVALTDEDGSKTQRVIHWGAQPQYTLLHRGPSCIDLVRLDPDQRLDEARPDANDDPLFNNVSSHKPKILVENLVNFATELNSGDVITSIGVLLARERDLHNALRTRFFLDQQSDGISVAYLRSFGPKADASRLTDSLEMGYLFEKLDPSFRSELGHKGKRSQGLFAFFKHNPLYYDMNPTEDYTIRARTEHSGRFIGSDLDFHIYHLEFTGYIPPRPTTVLAGRLRTGHLEGKAPSQKRFSAGGRAQMRGLGVDEFVGDDQFILSGEIRQMLVNDINWNALDVMRITGWQAVLFGDNGTVANEYSKLFRAHDWLGDVGAGLRMLVEYAGVRPAMIAFDIAWRIDGRKPDPPRYQLAFDASYFFFD